MPTLYVENVPADLYDALRSRARKRRASIAAEVIDVLRATVPTAQELRRRKRAFDQLRRLQAARPLRRGPFPSAQEMVREDRAR